jgi:hypothetical protein
MNNFLFSLSLTLFISCGMDGPIVNLAFKDKSTVLPKVQDNIVTGYATELAGGKASVSTLSGETIPGIESSVGNDGFFSLVFPGNTDFSNIKITVVKGSYQVFGVIPEIRKKEYITEERDPVSLEGIHSSMDDLNAKTASMILVILGKAVNDNMSISALSKDAILDEMTKINNMSQNANIKAFFDIVAEILSSAEKNKSGVLPFAETFPSEPQIIDLLNAKFFEEKKISEKMDEFAEKLKKAAGEIQLSICYSADTIRAVFLADMRDGKLDANCKVIDRFKWATDEEGKKMYFTGAVHKDTPMCGGDIEKPYCITKEELDKYNTVLGNWKPNVMEMYDDGTHGDSAKGDNIYTITFELPLIPETDALDWKGVRIGYKYTWGFPKQGWTDSQEWPGNQRIIELKDVKKDHMIIRSDNFADETTNKDKANLLLPSKGGCGVNFWDSEKAASEAKAKCTSDTHENQIDTDSNCDPDSWPSGGTAGPITVDCQK